LVSSSILPSGATFLVYTVYVLRGASGRHYIGQTSDMTARLAQHTHGHTHTTQRLGGNLELIAGRTFATRTEAMAVERMLKRWKNPRKAIEFLSKAG
jgi:predicted GIY-YIG superfamily endonuclease